jgi:hypothetical protein
MDADVRKLLEHVDRAVFTGPETWWGHDRHNVTLGGMCLFVALSRNSLDLFCLNGEDVWERSMGVLGFRSLSDLITWNDAPERTFDDIKRRLAVTLKEAVE